jgi:polyisoprenoid-binding protein YceI
LKGTTFKFVSSRVAERAGQRKPASNREWRGLRWCQTRLWLSNPFEETNRMRLTDRLLSRTLVIAAAVLALGASSGVVFAETETLNLDPAHTRVGFSIRHFFTKVQGEFKNVSGTIEVDQANLNATRVNVEIETASINTNNDRRDTHLRSADFFEAEKNPKITFVSKSVDIKGTKGTMTGDLTMHGVTRPVTLDVEVGGFGKMGPMGTIGGFNASGTLNRKDFGIVWNKVFDQGPAMLGDDVALVIDVEAKTPMKAPPAAPAAAPAPSGGK